MKLQGMHSALWADIGPEPLVLLLFSGHSLPCHTAHIKMKQQQFLFEGPKLKIGLEHNLKK